MNKAELVSKMAEKAELTKKEAEAALNAFMETVTEVLTEKDKLALIGFGTFETKERAARVGRNPRNPEETIEIPSSTGISFKPGKSLKEAVNQAN